MKAFKKIGPKDGIICMDRMCSGDMGNVVGGDFNGNFVICVDGKVKYDLIGGAYWTNGHDELVHLLPAGTQVMMTAK